MEIHQNDIKYNSKNFECQQQIIDSNVNSNILMMYPPIPPSMIPVYPLGLQALYDSLCRIYPDQTNPLQVSAVVKFWLGGPDPLDYISMYFNKGDEVAGIPEHWHYVSFGLSDLHGDGRVHPPFDPNAKSSGFGFELTFRLKKEPNETNPPTWPATVMQNLAQYVFQTNNILCAGDHVSWHCSLDSSESRIQHMLMAEDPQLGTKQTPFGSVTFIQIVGVCFEELKAAQQWNGPGVIDLMKSVSIAGGSWLVTDMRRGETIFELDPELREAVDDGIATEGSNLSGVCARCSYTTSINDTKDDALSYNHDKITNNYFHENENVDQFNDENEEKKITNDSMEKTSGQATRHSSMSVSHDRNSQMSFASETGANEAVELIQTKYLTSLHIKLNYEAGVLLPLALRGRLKHGRHFTFKDITGNLAITFVTSSVSGALVNLEQLFALHGPWLQVLIPEDHIEIILSELENIENLDKKFLPITYVWDNINLSITLNPEE